MSMKAFYLIGAAAVAIGAVAAVAVFAADQPATKPAVAATPATGKPAAAPAGKGTAPKGEHRIVHLQEPSFAEIDSNHDGSISQAEFDAFRAAHRPPTGEGPPPPGMMEGRGFGWGGHRGPEMQINRRFGGGEGAGMGGMDMRGGRALDLLDTNGDGKLSFDEMTAPLKRHFDRMDTNHDGVLSADEMKKGHDGLRGGSERDGAPPPPAQ